MCDLINNCIVIDYICIIFVIIHSMLRSQLLNGGTQCFTAVFWPHYWLSGNSSDDKLNMMGYRFNNMDTYHVTICDLNPDCILSVTILIEISY